LWIGKELVYLGTANRLDFKDDAGKAYGVRWQAGSMGLFCNHAGTAIYLLPLDTARQVKTPPGRKEGRKMFATWARRPASEALKVTIPKGAEELSKAGYALAILYTSDKWGTRPRKYIHDFKTGPVVYCDRKTNPRTWGILAVRGSRLVTGRGIIA
jgi:hypothetical protein